MAKTNELTSHNVEARNIVKGDLIVEGEDLLIAGRIDMDNQAVTVLTEEGIRPYALNEIVTVIR